MDVSHNQFEPQNLRVRHLIFSCHVTTLLLKLDANGVLPCKC